ncbi:VOC family protein [Oryzobacter telluris]|uniref:VOC family protein n=1 Tax=Oryzobacter telluris TaxID=3149179 RepID=UPI00370D81D7
MANTLNPYLNFPGTARDAMSFYQGVLGGDLTMNTFGEYGSDGPGADGIMHAQLTTPDGFTIMASDMPPGQEDSHSPGNNITVSLSGDGESLRGYWEGLSDGATVKMPLEKQMWGDEFGALVDKFGIPWMVNIAGEGNAG